MQKKIIKLSTILLIIFIIGVFFISLNKNSTYDTKNLVGQKITNIKLNHFSKNKIFTDKGGCFETSSPTTHDDPTFIHKGIVHYCVTNMPGAVPLTATEALNKVTLSYVENLANNGIRNALDSDEHLRNGLNILDGRIVHPGVKEALE